MDQAIDEGHYL